MVQDLNMEIESINKTQTEKILEMENLGKRTEATEGQAPPTEYKRWRRGSRVQKIQLKKSIHL